MNARWHVVIACALAVSACATVKVKPLDRAADVRQITPEEKRIWIEADEFDAAFENSDQVYRDEAATRYLQNVMDRLYPEFKGTIRVRIAKSPHLNAFALPNGSIYFHLGMLARLENEAQLATVLAHEGAHFIRKHGFQQRENVKGASAFALATAIIGIPLVGDVLALSSVYGYSRDLEREADRLGYQRLVRAGYEPRESVKAFEHLAAEVKALDVDEPYFFASHPKLQERIESFKELNAKQTKSGQVRQKEFLAITGRIRLACLESDLSMNRYKSVLLALGDAKRLKTYPGEAHYYLGEAYRQRADDGDDVRAENSYLKAASLAPGFAPTYRALGVHYMKHEKYATAGKYFDKYLLLAPNAADRDYVRQYRDMARKGGKQ